MDMEKYKLVVHYVIYLTRNASQWDSIGTTKLNKFLYYSDFLHYFVYGNSITGDNYIKKQFGPVPEKINDIIQYLKKEGKIQEIPEFIEGGRIRKKLIPMEPPEFGELKKEEGEIISDIVRKYLSSSAKEISDMSHNIVWKSFNMLEKIPYKMAYILYGTSNIEDSDIKWAKNVFERNSRAA